VQCRKNAQNERKVENNPELHDLCWPNRRNVSLGSDKRTNNLFTIQSGAKATAVQTLRARPRLPKLAQRLDCGRFTAAFLRLPLQKFRHRFRARPHLKFFVDAADVSMHGLVADVEFLGDFLVDQTLREQIQNLLFAFGKFG